MLKRCFRHFTYTDRIKLETLHTSHASVSYIARYLGFSVSAVYRELERGAYNRASSELVMFKAYSADIAQKDYDYKATNKGAPIKLGTDFKLAEFIEETIISKNYSPAAVLGQISQGNVKFTTSICTKTLYNYIDKGVFLNLTNAHLPRKKNTRQQYKKVRFCRIKKPLCRSIEERPIIVETRKEFGHWEMDTVIGKSKGKGQALLVLTERKTRQELIIKLRAKTCENVVLALDKLERIHGSKFKAYFKTITVDNGSEFMDCCGMEKSCRTKKNRTTIYYCHSFSSWERGSNENANTLIRRFIPKGTPLENYTTKEISYIEHWINNYPRKIHNFKCSNSLYIKEVENIG